MMNSKTISILGCGYLGLPVASTLVNKGWRVRGSTTREDRLRKLLAAGVEPYLLRLNPAAEGRAIRDFFQSETLLICFPPGRKRPDVETFLHAAVSEVIRYTDTVRFMVFASSTSVYRSGRVAECDAFDPLTASGRALLSAEKQLRACSGFSTTVLRFGGLYGYARQPGRFTTVVPNGAAPVNLVHRDDAVAVTVSVIEMPIAGEVFNVVADLHPRKDTFYRQAAAWIGKAPPEFQYDATRPGKHVSGAKLAKHLGYRFLHPDPMCRAP